MEVLDFLSLYSEYIVACVLFMLAVVSFLVTLFTKRNVSKSIESFKEVLDLKKSKYLTADTRNRSQQSFSEEVADYVLSARTNELELSPIPKNIQDYINSHIETALERALERFTVPNAIEEDIVEDYTSHVNDLASIGEAIEIAEHYRDELQLPDSASIADIYSAVDKRASELKLKLDSHLKEVNDGKKEEIKKENE